MFYENKDRLKINQWLMAQMGYVGPMIGQHHQFHHYNPGKSKFGEERYFKITKSIYNDLDERLFNSKFLAGDNYSIADIATWPWIARHKWHDIGLKKFKNLTRWYLEISNREAVKKGYKFMKQGDKIPYHKYMEKNYKNYFKYYLISISVFAFIWLYLKHDVGNDSTISEWIINYQGGFTRRGLPGEIAFHIAQIFDLKLRFAILLMQIFLWTIFNSYL